MLEKSMSFLVKKIAEAALKGKKVDLQLLQCLLDLYFESPYSNDDIEDINALAQNILNGIQLFDSYGNPEKLYASLCYVFNKLLTKDEYYMYSDLLLKKIVEYSELSAYINPSAFKERIMTDFEPENVKFKKTKLMIYRDLKSFNRKLKYTFGNTAGALLHDKHAGTHIIRNISNYHVDISKQIYGYCFTPDLKVTKLPAEYILKDVENNTVTVNIDKRCTVCLCNIPLKPINK